MQSIKITLCKNSYLEISRKVLVSKILNMDSVSNRKLKQKVTPNNDFSRQFYIKKIVYASFVLYTTSFNNRTPNRLGIRSSGLGYCPGSRILWPIYLIKALKNAHTAPTLVFELIIDPLLNYVVRITTRFMCDQTQCKNRH